MAGKMSRTDKDYNIVINRVTCMELGFINEQKTDNGTDKYISKNIKAFLFQ